MRKFPCVFLHCSILYSRGQETHGGFCQLPSTYILIIHSRPGELATDKLVLNIADPLWETPRLGSIQYWPPLTLMAGATVTLFPMSNSLPNEHSLFPSVCSPKYKSQSPLEKDKGNHYYKHLPYCSMIFLMGTVLHFSATLETAELRSKSWTVVWSWGPQSLIIYLHFSVK